MPLTRCPDDISLEIVAYLPLQTIGRLSVVQKTWKVFLLEAYEETIYHNAAHLHCFLRSITTSLTDETAAIDSTTALDITNWKRFCQVRLAIEKSWCGEGPSLRKKVDAMGDQVFRRRSIPGYTIISSVTGGISVFKDHETVWALPSYEPTYFVYDQGYLVFTKRDQKFEAVIEIWCDPSMFESVANSSDPRQQAAVASNALLYGPPAPGHFLPVAWLPAPDAMISSSISLLYPTLLAATNVGVHIWDIATRRLLHILNTDAELDAYTMVLSGIQVTRDFVIAFDDQQLRFSPGLMGTFSFFFPRQRHLREVFSWRLPRTAIPRHNRIMAQSCSETSYFANRDVVNGPTVEAYLTMVWVYFLRSTPADTSSTVAASLCGKTLAILTSTWRILIVKHLSRVISGKFQNLYSSMRYLDISGTKLFFNSNPNTHIEEPDDELFYPKYDDLPEVQDVSDSDDEGGCEDLDESDHCDHDSDDSDSENSEGHQDSDVSDPDTNPEPRMFCFLRFVCRFHSGYGKSAFELGAIPSSGFCGGRSVPNLSQ
ncbi:hypothetical protein C8J57DRAFT_1617738 [Mycena rebaudengoi]|nr:hypothetical protein C8J57DRAFT_1617738 [Mycena rebaudengoi]